MPFVKKQNHWVDWDSIYLLAALDLKPSSCVMLLSFSFEVTGCVKYFVYESQEGVCLCVECFPICLLA